MMQHVQIDAPRKIDIHLIERVLHQNSNLVNFRRVLHQNSNLVENGSRSLGAVAQHKTWNGGIGTAHFQDPVAAKPMPSSSLRGSNSLRRPYRFLYPISGSCRGRPSFAGWDWNIFGCWMKAKVLMQNKNQEAIAKNDKRDGTCGMEVAVPSTNS